jgi:hypothetical protein
MPTVKALVDSKTFQLAALQAIAGMIVVFSTAYPQLGWIVLAKSVLDVVLRMYTTQPIGSVL